MNKSMFVLLVVYCVSIYSVQCGTPTEVPENIIKKNNASCCAGEIVNQPMFEYKINGSTRKYSQKDVEKYIKTSYSVVPTVAFNAIIFACLKKADWSSKAKLEILATLLVTDVAIYFVMKDFQSHASAWLKALKEKEDLSKNEN